MTLSNLVDCTEEDRECPFSLLIQVICAALNTHLRAEAAAIASPQSPATLLVNPVSKKSSPILEYECPQKGLKE